MTDTTGLTGLGIRVSGHASAADPHGDRAYTNASIAALPPAASTPNIWTPARNNLKSANFYPGIAGSVRGTTLGQPLYVKVPWETTATIANVLLGLKTLGATLTAAANLAGLYSVSGTTATLIGSSADQSAAWASPGTVGNKTIGLTEATSGSLTGVTGADGAYLLVAILAVGTTAPQWYAANAQASYTPDVTQIGLGASDGYTSFQVGGQTGRTTLYSSFSISGATAQGIVPFVGLT